MNGQSSSFRGDRAAILAFRSRVLRAIRGFFYDRDFIEVETPIRLPAPALELHIDAENAGPQFLRTSPELHMKRLLADGVGRMFQMGPCFRKGELGRLHNPEYTMLEWYRADADYTDILLDTKMLIQHVAREVLGKTRLSYDGTEIELMPVWDVLTVSDAFLLNAGWDPVQHFDADRFDLDLVEKVEPALPRDRPVILKDYPREAAALARCRPGPPPVAERWELYLGGVELANAFTELTDPVEQRLRFEECARARAEAGREIYPLDNEFLQALERGLPPCGGIALGVDRLVMILAGRACIQDVRAF